MTRKYLINLRLKRYINRSIFLGYEDQKGARSPAPDNRVAGNFRGAGT